MKEPKEPVYVLTTGSRRYSYRMFLRRALGALLLMPSVEYRGLIVVHGGCPTGADALVDEWCRENGVVTRVYPADWSQGRSAGPRRNALMVAAHPYGLCLGFPLPGPRDLSRGTWNTIDLARKHGIPCPLQDA